MRAKTGFLVAVLSISLGSAVVADQIQMGYPGSSYGPFQSGIGGEFTVLPLNPAGWLNLSAGYVSGVTSDKGVAGSFQTFCIEGGEHIGSYPSTYDAVVNQNAIYGGVGPQGDPLSVGTGWLYSEFISQGLAGYGYDYVTLAGRKDSAADLQAALWWLEGELGLSYDPNNDFMKAAVDKFGSAAAAQVDGGWKYGVYALNLTIPSEATTGSDGITVSRYQDVLVKVPDGGMTLALLGIAVGCVGMASRWLRS